jgi:hypothetical protein
MMPGDSTANAAASFDPLRPRLIRIAYRMLGSVADAEDIAQEAFIRWMEADRDTVREPEAFLRRVVTRLFLDQLKSARHQRETYVGPWLPEPVVEPTPTPDDLDDITLPLMMTLERACRHWNVRPFCSTTCSTSVSRKSRRRSAASRRRAGSLPPVPGRISGGSAPVSRCLRNAASRSRPRFLPPPATVTWSVCARSWLRT